MTDAFARKALLRALRGFTAGSLELIDGPGAQTFGDPAADLHATVVVHHPRFYSRVIFGGENGAGDSFMDGDWSSPDPVAVIRLAVRNLPRMERATPALNWAARSLDRLRHLRRGNTVAGSRRNIQEHYDLSNEFFQLFLDRNLVYSSAIFESPSTSLEAAQIEKIDRLCRKLHLQPDDHLLEIGTGWGAFALHAAQHYGCRVTTTTISQRQFEAARELFASSGPAGARINLLSQDYRKLTGRFDKIVSVEMFEAVGLSHYDDFFGACDRLLSPNGVMAMQAITMNEQKFAAYHQSADWIQRRIFPGSELASVREILASLGRVTGMSLVHLEDIGLHYALTLREWRSRFHAKLADVRALGFDDRFVRMWDYYLCYCEGAFLERHIGDVQLVLAKRAAPESNGFSSALSPPLRDSAMKVGSPA